MTPYEHGTNAARRSACCMQACPYDTNTPEAREWCAGFCEARNLVLIVSRPMTAYDYNNSRD